MPHHPGGNRESWQQFKKRRGREEKEGESAPAVQGAAKLDAGGPERRQQSLGG